MCGIAGIFDPAGRLSSIETMNDVQAHRGPDGEGYVYLDTVAPRSWVAPVGVPPGRAPGRFDLVLANRRLAILDLSPSGRMPMSYGDALWLTFNGEVFNYRELRAELSSLGHVFRGTSDTEVVLAAYSEWRDACLERFNGMFGFALWDGRTRTLFCARDRFGIKPFYYFWNGRVFAFASEIKSLLQHPDVPRVPNDAALYDYLALGVSDHTEETFFEGVKTLAPGQFLRFSPSQRRLSHRQWWHLDFTREVGERASKRDERPYDEFASLLADAVRLRLRSDVPVGSCLSGGLDSSTIVHVASRLLRDEHALGPAGTSLRPRTFTVRNEQPEIDEFAFSKLMADRTGAQMDVVFPCGHLLWRELESFVWHMDEPVNSTSQYAQWNVMRLARQASVPVLLDGQGGDEVLAGYYSYYQPYLSQIRQRRGRWAAARALWDVSRVGGSPVVNELLRTGLSRLPSRLRGFVTWMYLPESAPGTGGSSLTDHQLQTAFMRRHWERRWQPPAPVDADGLGGVLHREIVSTNLPKLLRYEDRNSMAFSIETRLPFLDHRLVQMVFRLPLDFRIRHGWTKWLLRQSFARDLPAEVCWRRGKLGFPTPEAQWLREGAGTIRHLLQSHAELVSEYVCPTVLDDIRALPDDELARTPGLWRTLNVMVWLDLFFRRSPGDAFRADVSLRPAAPVLRAS